MAAPRQGGKTAGRARLASVGAHGGGGGGKWGDNRGGGLRFQKQSHQSRGGHGRKGNRGFD